MSHKPTISPEYFEDLVKEGMSHLSRDTRLQVILERSVERIEKARKKGLTHATLVVEDGELSPELIGLLESSIKPVRLTIDDYYGDDDSDDDDDDDKQRLTFNWGPIDVSSKSKCIIV